MWVPEWPVIRTRGPVRPDLTRARSMPATGGKIWAEGGAREPRVDSRPPGGVAHHGKNAVGGRIVGGDVGTVPLRLTFGTRPRRATRAGSV